MCWGQIDADELYVHLHTSNFQVLALFHKAHAGHVGPHATLTTLMLEPRATHISYSAGADIRYIEPRTTPEKECQALPIWVKKVTMHVLREGNR